MFEAKRPTSKTRSAAGLLELIYHATVREIRKDHGHAVIGLLLNILQTLIFVAAFYALFAVMRVRPSGIRGDFLLFIMSGVFLFMVHIKSIGAVFGAEGPSSAMMKHAPMNTIVAIASKALSALYLQVLSMTVLLFFYHALVNRLSIYDPAGAMGMILLAWSTGVGIGMVLLAAKPWNPTAVGIMSTIVQRINMVASGKMVVANMLGFGGLYIFGWNPLYHAIDQARGFVFANYTPRFTSISYPVYATLVLITLGLMCEFYTRRHASVSWDAKR